MNKIEKEAIVAEMVDAFNSNNVVYLTDTDGLSATSTNKFRRLLFENGIQMRMVKNTLFNAGSSWSCGCGTRTALASTLLAPSLFRPNWPTGAT